MSIGFGLIVRSRAGMPRCSWCFIVLMNLHDFVAELVNFVYSFHDAHIVLFCLTTDDISTCLMMFSARFKTAQFWSVLIRGEWKCGICYCQRRWCGVPARRIGTAERVWKFGSFHGVPMDSAVWIRDWWTSRQLATDAVVCTVSLCLDSWQRMQWYATSHGVTTAGNGCSGMQRLSVSRQLVMDTVERFGFDQVKYLFLSVDD